MKKHQITLKYIARKLGLSVSTVSRALKDHPDISAETKKKVVKMAENLNYSPNQLALNLKFSKSNVIGVLIPEIVHHFFSNVISGIIDIADKKNYSVILFQTNESYQREVRETRLLLPNRVDGLLISLANDTTNYGHLNDFLKLNIPVVLFDKVCDELEVSKVIVDDKNGAYKAVEHLIKEGYRKIAHIKGPKLPKNARDRYEGYCQALSDYGISFRKEYIMECKKVTQEEGYQFTNQLLNLPDPPEAIFAITDLVAVGAMLAIKDNGLRIPEDIALIGFSDWHVASVLEPSLSSVFQPGFKMGQEATRILLEEIKNIEEDKPVNYQVKILKTKLIVRNSSARPKA